MRTFTINLTIFKTEREAHHTPNFVLETRVFV